MFLFSLITFSVDAHTCICLWEPEVGVRDHLWVHACAHACADLRLVQESSVGTLMCACLCGPEVSVRDHLWVHTCAYACGGLRLVLGIILSGSPLYSWRWGFLSQARSLLIWLALQAILGGGSVGGSLCLFLKAGTPGGWLHQPGI